MPEIESVPDGQLSAPGFDRLLELVDRGVIRILDIEFVAKDAAGARVVTVADLPAGPDLDLSAWVGSSSGLLDADDIALVGDEIAAETDGRHTRSASPAQRVAASSRPIARAPTYCRGRWVGLDQSLRDRPRRAVEPARKVRCSSGLLASGTEWDARRWPAKTGVLPHRWKPRGLLCACVDFEERATNSFGADLSGLSPMIARSCALRRGAGDERGLGSSRALRPERSLTVAPRVVGRRFGEAIAGAALCAAITVGCAQSTEVLPNEAFRNFVPLNAELLDEAVDGGDSLTIDGESSVLRTFDPVPPAEAPDVFEVLVAEGEDNGWSFTDRSTSLAVATKDVDGRPWMVSIAVEDDTVRQLFAGR
jgi:hypothetical protein